MGKKRRNNQGNVNMSEQELQDKEVLQEGTEDNGQTQETSEVTEVSAGVAEAATPPNPEDHTSQQEEIEEAPADDANAAAVELPVAEPKPEPVADSNVNLGVKDESAPAVEEVKPVPPAPVVEQPVNLEAPASAETVAASENLAYIENVRANGTPIQKQALETIELFCQRMVPRAPITATQAIEAQRDLLDFITVLLRKDYEEFRKGWATLLVYFAEYHGDRPTAKDYSALSEYSTSRHLDAWSDDERASAYNNLVTLLRVTRNAETRKQDVKRVRIDTIAPNFLNARSQDNLQRFYG